ncbi:MAG: PLP-dependent transferase [Acidimicrobiia bacterium]|nr:PLP-dependent transferase [Acidimicrobiia bacterium]
MSGDPFTQALHGDDAIPDAADVGPPIHVASTYDRSEQGELVYRRNQHITTERLEAVLGALEGGEAVVYPSGMAAIASLLRYLNPARIYLPADVYHGTRSYVTAAPRAWQAVEAFDDLGPGDVAWLETPSNPKCLITDVAAVAADLGSRGVTVVVDSTFATPVLQRPLSLGADYVVHSSTKYIGGHSDAMGGVVVTADSNRAAELLEARVIDGTIPGSLDVWLTLRGVRTLPLRIARQSETAASLAEYLDGRGLLVWYPGLGTHPGHQVAARQMSQFGAIVSFELSSYEEAAEAATRFEVFRRATSLGGVESVVEHRASVNPLAPPGLLRLSVGLESPADLIADLDAALIPT